MKMRVYRAAFLTGTSVCRSASGELIFGGTNGLTVFNPSRIKYNFYPPTVAVTGFLVQNDQILPGQPYNGRIILQDDISYCNELSLPIPMNVVFL